MEAPDVGCADEAGFENGLCAEGDEGVALDWEDPILCGIDEAACEPGGLVRSCVCVWLGCEECEENEGGERNSCGSANDSS